MQTTLPRYFTSAGVKIHSKNSFRYHVYLQICRCRQEVQFWFLVVVVHQSPFVFMHSDKTFSLNGACSFVFLGTLATCLSSEWPSPFGLSSLSSFSSFPASEVFLLFSLLYFLTPRPVPFENASRASPGLR